jgi:hypothetical protein
MTELRSIFQDAPQEIVGERLYYYVTKDEFQTLRVLAEGDPPLQRAIQQTLPVARLPGVSRMIPVDLVQDAERSS